MSNIIGPVVTHLLCAKSFPQLSKAVAAAFETASPVAFDLVLLHICFILIAEWLQR